MITSQLDLEKAAQKVFGSSAEQIVSPANYWHMFKPFKIGQDSARHTVLLKLIEIPSRLRTSEENIRKMKLKFNDLIHQVDFIQVQRNFEKTVYLVTAGHNLVSVESYLQIKRQAQEKVEEQVIQNFLDFARQLEAHQLANKISFSLKQIGMDKHNKFYLANYELYFISSDQISPNCLSRDIRHMLCKLLMSPNNKDFDFSQMYSHVQQNYSPKVQQLTEKIISNVQFKASQVTEPQTCELNQNLLQTTLTDSFHTEHLTQQDTHNISSETADISLSLLPQSSSKHKKSRLRSYIFFAIFLVSLICIGAITYKFLSPRPLTCLQSQYLDKQLNQCLGCDSTCGTCMDKSISSCLSCNDNQFLVKKVKTDRNGKCNTQCAGIRLKSNVCIDNQVEEAKRGQIDLNKHQIEQLQNQEQEHHKIME